MRIKSLLLTALCLICTTPVFADFTDGDFTFSENGSNCTLIGYSGAGGDLTIPSVATNAEDASTYTVTTIGYDVFKSRDDITSVIIPNGILEIGAWSFRECINLAEVTIGNSVATIGEEAFAYCLSLAEITIPNSVTTIGMRAFLNCSSLTSITIPESVTVIGDYAFALCGMLTEINVAVGNTSWASEDGVLYNKNKSRLYTYPAGKRGPFSIPSSVTEIATVAFSGCSYLSSITIPNSVTTIGSEVFLYCYALTAINVDEGNISWASEDGALYNKNKSLLYTCPAGKSGPFAIPSSVTEIASSAFSSCIYLSSITIPNSVTTIGERAFFDCSSLTEVTIPNSVTVLEGGVFMFCTGLVSVVIPNSVTTIGNSAFESCRSLTSVVIPNSVTDIGGWAFHDCRSLTSVVIPNSVTDIGDYAFYSCAGLTDVTVSWPTPLVVSNGTFQYVDLSNCTLHVPAGTEDLYAAAEVWRDFNIVASSTVPDEPEDDNLMPTAVALNLNEVSLKAGETVQLSATVSPDDAINKEVVWESSDTEVATVSATGLVTALSEGTATITVTTAYRSHTDQCIVTVTKDDDDEGNGDSVEAVNSNKAEVTLSDGILTVNSPAAEQVEVYALTGALLHRESKAAGSLILNIGHLPKGILIVRGNSGWTQKIILK